MTLTWAAMSERAVVKLASRNPDGARPSSRQPSATNRTTIYAAVLAATHPRTDAYNAEARVFCNRLVVMTAAVLIAAGTLLLLQWRAPHVEIMSLAEHSGHGRWLVLLIVMSFGGAHDVADPDLPEQHLSARRCLETLQRVRRVTRADELEKYSGLFAAASGRSDSNWGISAYAFRVTVWSPNSSAR